MIFNKKAPLSQGARNRVSLSTCSVVCTSKAPQHFDFYFESTFTFAPKSNFLYLLFHLELRNNPIGEDGTSLPPSSEDSRLMFV